MRKKLLLSLIAVLLLATGARAQTEFGLKAGLSFPSYHYDDSETLAGTGSITSFYLTGYLDGPIISGLYLHPKVSLQGKGSKLTESELLGSGKIKQKVMWLDFTFNFLSKAHLGLANIVDDANKWSRDIKNRVFSLGVGARL